MTNRVDLLLEVGVDIDTAIAIDDEVSRLPERTQRVFDMRVKGYTQQEIAEREGITQKNISIHQKRCVIITNEGIIPGNITPYRDRG